MDIRRYKAEDCALLAELFYETVHCVNSADYTAEQLDAWANGSVDLTEWNRSFLLHHTLVARMEGQFVGFGDIDCSGYLDRLFVHKDYQRCGIGTALCDALELAAGSEQITVHASITARDFFKNRGYRTIGEQRVVRNGVSLLNYVMVKHKAEASA
ncbi:MAG: GNAT family N-acetyltransferase [Ruminococcaceae bacterium]|nr:GNAT family N-acetyltransferase [Oscillospiraceae bacterium]